MFKLLAKIFSIPNKTIKITSEACESAELLIVGKKINDQVKRLFGGSLAIRQVDAGSDNACEQELVALSNAFYDAERFGIHFVASPKHADMLMVTGPVTRNMAEALRRAYNVTPEPKIIVAVGDDAINGGLFKGSYAVADGVDAVVPVHYQIPGDPPTPTTILCHLLKILETLDKKSPR
jgi:Ni,Fe-hydrogenase III small subunit